MMRWIPNSGGSLATRAQFFLNELDITIEDSFLNRLEGQFWGSDPKQVFELFFGEYKSFEIMFGLFEKMQSAFLDSVLVED